MKVLLISILNRWNILTSRQVTCLLPQLILSSHLPLNLRIHQDIPSITKQRLPIYLKKISIAKGLSEESSNHKNAIRTYLKKKKIESLKTEIISSLESTFSSLFQKELNTLKDKCEKLTQNSYSNYINWNWKKLKAKAKILAKYQQHLATSIAISF